MHEHTWDPDRYLAYADERGRPFVDLLARVARREPARGRRPRLRPRQPHRPAGRPLARRRGDGASTRSPEMIEAARAVDGVRLGGRRPARLGAPRPAGPAAPSTCWSPTPPSSGSRTTSTCCRGSSTRSRPGGWFAFQVPGNFDEPSHTIRTDLAARDAVRRARARRRASPTSHDPADYLAALADLGCEVDAWETTYLHVLTGADPVFDWVSGTGARPTLQALPDDLRPLFEESSRRRCARPTRPTPPAAWSCRSAASSWWRASEACRSVRLHHVQVACPRGGEDVARRFYAEALGMTEVDKPADLAGARRVLVPGVRRRGRRGGRAARRRRGPVRTGPQGAPGLRRRRPRADGGRSAAQPRLRGRREPAGLFPATSGSTPSTATATGSRCCSRPDVTEVTHW